MPDTQASHRLATRSFNGTNPCAWLEWASLIAALAALVVGFSGDSGASASARAAVLLLATLAFAATVLSMAIEGRWRITRGALWLVPGMLAALPMLQMFPLTLVFFGGVAATGQVPGATTITASRHSTLETIWFGVANLLIMGVVAHQARTRARLAFLVVAMAMLTGGAGLWGLMAPGAAANSSIGLSSAIGPLAYHPWSASGVATNAPSWFTPAANPLPSFVGFCRREHWVALAFLLAPVLVVMTAAELGRAEGPNWRDGARQLDGRAKFAIGALLAFAALMGLVAPSLSITAVFGMVLTLTAMLSARPERRRTIGVALVATISMVLGALIGGSRGFGEPERFFVGADSAAVAKVFLKHGPLGVGAGALGEILPLYRSVSAEIPFRASSLLMLLAEVGWLGAAALVAIAGYSGYSWVTIRSQLDRETSQAATGLVSGALALLLWCALAPGLEAPVVVMAFALVWGLLARALAGPNAFEDRGKAA